MKYKIVSLFFLGMIYAQCENFGQFECNSDQNCEWVENIDSGFCSDFDYNSALCDSINQCDWTSYEIDCGTATGYSDCDISAGCSYSWLTYTCSGWTTVSDCSGGYYEIDNGYCQEIEMPVCSEMDETVCTGNDDCEWIENIELESCNDIHNQQECNAVGCSWYNGNYYACSICCWGEYEVDNSYCEEAPNELGDINQDDIINVMDIISVVNLILNDRYEEIADINQDQYINVIDILLIVDIILNN